MRFLVVSATYFSPNTGCGQRGLKVLSELVAHGNDVTVLSAVLPSATSLSTAPSVRLVVDVSELNGEQYDVVWLIDNWAVSHIDWAIKVAKFAKRRLGVRYMVEATGDHLATGKAHLKSADPDAYAAFIRLEQELWKLSDLVLTVSEPVRIALSQESSGPDLTDMMILPLSKDLRDPKRFVYTSRRWSVCMAGSLHARNHKAYIWFLKAIWPKVQSARPHLRLEIFGRGTEVLRSIGNELKNVSVLGEVDDFCSALSGNLMLLVPADAPGGVKTVTIDALAVGTPVLAVAPVNARLGLEDGPGLYSASANDIWVNTIVGFVSHARQLEAGVSSHLLAQYKHYQAINSFESNMSSILKRIERDLSS